MRLSDRSLLLISLGVSVFGILGLLGVLLTSDLEESSLDAALFGDLDEPLLVRGMVSASSRAGNVTFLTIRQECEVVAVSFQPLNVSKGSQVLAEGIVQEYRGEREIILSALTIVEKG